jgi:hypothetical protein
MTRDQIISELYVSKEVNDCIDTYGLSVHSSKEDFKHELFWIVCNIENSLLQTLYDNKEIIRYLARIVINLRRQKRNVFHQTYLNTNVTYNTDQVETLQVQESDQCIKDRLQDEMNELELVKRVHELDGDLNTPAYRLMVILVERLGSQREVARVTGVHPSVISRGIKKVRECLK